MVIGAGPAGLRAAQVLAEAGREVLVLEKNEEVGPKTCAGGLTVKAIAELRALGLPADAGRPFTTEVTVEPGPTVVLDPAHATVRTFSRRTLGRFQLARARRAGAEVRTATPARRLDLDARTLEAGRRTIRYRHLIGADGSTSAVRRALGLPARRAIFAGEFNIAGARFDRLIGAFDPAELDNGYFWIFPHEDYVSVGAMVHKAMAPPSRVRPYVERRLTALELDPGETPFEGATLEADFVGLDHANAVHLAGDAAGTPSALTGEGIYAALITGEEVARGILESGYPKPKTRSWLRSKRVHDSLSSLWRRPPARAISFRVLPPLCRSPAVRRWLSKMLVEG